MGRKCITLLLITAVLLSCALTAYAQEFDYSRTGSITITLLDPKDSKPIQGAQFDVYLVADVGINTQGKLNYTYTDTYKTCGIALEDPDLAAKLTDYVVQNRVVGQRIVTNANGIAGCTNIKLGLYLIRQSFNAEGYSDCTSFLVMVPMQNGADFTYDVNASPKTDVVKLVDITVKKVWNAGKTGTIPASVTVELLSGEKVVQSAILTKENNWQVVFADQPQRDDYTVREVEVPKGYTATYSSSGNVFTVTNTSSLAQTGQLTWPIPVLAAVGLLLMLMGVMILRKPGRYDA